jgi:hypothetical protein
MEKKQEQRIIIIILQKNMYNQKKNYEIFGITMLSISTKIEGNKNVANEKSYKENKKQHQLMHTKKQTT